MPTPLEQLQADVTAIRDAIGGIIKTAIPKIRVHNRLMFDVPQNEWSNMLRSKDDANRVNAVQVRLNGSDFQDAGMSRVNRSAGFKLPFQLIFTHYWGLGTNAANSESDFVADIMAATWSLGSNPTLGVNRVAGHEGLRTGPILPDVVGEDPILKAQSRFVVLLDYRLIVGQ